jgi:hypothetical protein
MAALLIGFWLCIGAFFYLTLLAHVFWIPWSAWLRIPNSRPAAGAALLPGR